MTTTPRAPRRGRPKSDGPDPVDVHVGERIKLRRVLLCMSQDALGKSIGVTFQQVQKYERGVSRIGASRLVRIGRALTVPVSFFFDDMPAETGTAVAGAADTGPAGERDLLGKRETMDLVCAYYSIPDPAVRRLLLDTTRAVAVMGQGAGARALMKLAAG